MSTESRKKIRSASAKKPKTAGAAKAAKPFPATRTLKVWIHPVSFLAELWGCGDAVVYRRRGVRPHSGNPDIDQLRVKATITVDQRDIDNTAMVRAIRLIEKAA